MILFLCILAHYCRLFGMLRDFQCFNLMTVSFKLFWVLWTICEQKKRIPSVKKSPAKALLTEWSPRFVFRKKNGLSFVVIVHLLCSEWKLTMFIICKKKNFVVLKKWNCVLTFVLFTDEVFYVMNCTLISLKGLIFWNTIHDIHNINNFLLQIFCTDIKEYLYNGGIQD